MRNTSDVNVDAIVRIKYTKENGNRGTVSVNNIKLRPFEVDQVNLQTLNGLNNVKVAGIEIEYSGVPGGVVASAQSVSNNRNFVFRTLLWDPPNVKSAASVYTFTINNNSYTKGFIKNVSPKDEKYVSHLTWGTNGIYVIPMAILRKGETVEIDVKKLRDNQIPDEAGRLIPQNVSQGQIHWSLRRSEETLEAALANRVPLVGQAMQIDNIAGTSFSYFCYSCCELGAGTSPELLPSNTILQHPDVVQYSVYEDGLDCYSNTYVYRNVTSSAYNWSSTNTGVATVNGSGFVSSAGAGSTQIKMKINFPYHFFYGDCEGGPGFPSISDVGMGCKNDYRLKLKTENKKASFVRASYSSIPYEPAECECITLSGLYQRSVALSVRPKVTDVTAANATKIASVLGDLNIIHFVTPKDASQNQVTLTATLSDSSQSTLNDISWEGATESGSNPLQATLSRSSASKNVVKIKYNGTVIKELRVWVVWATIVSVNHPIQDSSNCSQGIGVPLTTSCFAIKGGYAFTHTINPTTIVTDSDRPDLSGAKSNANGPPGGNHPLFVNDPLTGGADKKWDSSRQMKLKILSSFTIASGDSSQPPFIDVPNYPANDVEGNDDRSVTDEVNDPYANNGVLSETDDPIYALADRAGADGDTFELRFVFQEFTRVELQGNWYRISDSYWWRTNLKFLKINGLWTNNGSSIALDNAIF